MSYLEAHVSIDKRQEGSVIRWNVLSVLLLLISKHYGLGATVWVRGHLSAWSFGAQIPCAQTANCQTASRQNDCTNGCSIDILVTIAKQDICVDFLIAQKVLVFWNFLMTGIFVFFAIFFLISLKRSRL